MAMTADNSGVQDVDTASQRGPVSVAQSAGLLVSDIASTLVFLAVTLATHSVPLAVGAGMIVGVGQIVRALLRHRRIDFMQWMSLVLVLVSGSIALLTSDSRIVMAKPSVIYVVVGAMMLKPGWITRYLPPAARHEQAGVALAFGYAWASLMFLTAAVNLVLVFQLDTVAWSEAISVFAIASKVALFLVQYAVMRFIGRRRRGEDLAQDRVALTV